jgi:hypothetical protein
MRPLFDEVCSTLLSVSPTARGELTTIYIKFLSEETNGRPYAVLWVKRASEMVLGLSLPEDRASPEFEAAPAGCKYAGLTKYLCFHAHDGSPNELLTWALEAHQHAAVRTES